MIRNNRIRPTVLAIWLKIAIYLLNCVQFRLNLICGFDPQLKKILAFSVKDRYQLNYFICINAETNTSLKLNLFSFFICGCQHHQATSGVYAITVTTSAYHSRRCGRL
jgi:hypothetical protein